MAYLGDLPSARQSPRIAGGILKWYEGDTFDLQVDLSLQDQDGDTVTVQSGDTVTFTFKNKKRQTVKTFTFTNIKNNLVVLSFDTETTALFPKGEYRADVCYQGEQRVTLADSCPVLVE